MFDGAGKIFQNAYIVDDIDEMIGHWVKLEGAGPFFVHRRLQLDIEYRGAPSSIDIDLAIGQAGPVHIELIKVHCDNPTVYTDTVPKGSGPGFHHNGYLAKDFNAAIAAYEQAGYQIAMKGIFGQTPFVYVDTVNAIGCFTEFHEDTAEIRSMFKYIADASVDWDGSRPERPMSELLAWMNE